MPVSVETIIRLTATTQSAMSSSPRSSGTTNSCSCTKVNTASFRFSTQPLLGPIVATKPQSYRNTSRSTWALTDISFLQATGQRIGTVVQSVATLGLAMGLALSYEWRLGLVALCFTPLILVSTYFMMRVMHGNAFGTQDSLEKSTKVSWQTLSYWLHGTLKNWRQLYSRTTGKNLLPVYVATSLCIFRLQ